MIRLDILKNEFPQAIRGFEREVLREYLQCLILQILFESDYANKFCFLGGTSIRLVHNSNRFSEDLDFDNFSISKKEFIQVSDLIRRQLNLQGFNIDVEIVGKAAFRLDIKFVDVLQEYNLTGHKNQKLLIQFDTEAQKFDYKPEQFILNRFGVFSQLIVTPVDLLLAQNFYAILNRPRNKGRDFYDVVFLLGMNVKPNYDYLEFKLGIDNEKELKERIWAHCQKLDMKAQAIDVQPFLFNIHDMKMIEMFPAYIKQVKL
jgi:predicted nucleotidyltransferase component of viral defense system